MQATCSLPAGEDSVAFRAGRFYVLCARPLVLGCVGGTGDGGRPGFPVPGPSSRPAVVLHHVAWWCAPDHAMSRYARVQARLQALGVEHHLLVNASDENRSRSAWHVRGAHVSHNIHIDERCFHPRRVRRSYDAIYVAQLRAYKRLELARDIARLRVLSYGGDLPAFCPELAHAHCNARWMGPEAVAEAICSAHCGLCLSEEEGGMLASMEYLLCGVPVVSTESRGGREELFPAGACIRVDADRRAVAAAVKRWCRAGVDAQWVRACALERLLPVRRRFCEYVAGIIAARGGGDVAPEHLQRVLYGQPGGIGGRAVPAAALGQPGALDRYRFELPGERPVPVRGAGLVQENGQLLVRAAGRRAALCNAPAAMIWELCDGQRSVADIAAVIRAEVPGAPRDVELEIGATLRRFAAIGALHAG